MSPTTAYAGQVITLTSNCATETEVYSEAFGDTSIPAGGGSTTVAVYQYAAVGTAYTVDFTCGSQPETTTLMITAATTSTTPSPTYTTVAPIASYTPWRPGPAHAGAGSDGTTTGEVVQLVGGSALLAGVVGVGAYWTWRSRRRSPRH